MANIIKLGGGSGGSQPVLITKSITENGTYNAVDDSADGYSSVEVDIGGLGTTQFRYIKMTISAINGGTHLQMSEIGFKTNDGTIFSMPTGYTATSSLPMFDPMYSIYNLFDSNTNTKIVITWTAGTSVEDITIDLGSGNYLDIEDYPYFFWSSSDDDSQYQGRTPRTFTVVGANQSDFSDSVILVDEPILEKITTNRTEAYRVKMSINGIIPAKTLLYSLEQTQGGQWFNTNIDTTQYDKLLFINSVNSDDEYMREIAISDIVVVNSGTSDTYTEVFSAGAIGKMFICHIYNNELWVGYNASGSSGNVVGIYEEINGGGGGGIGEYIDLSSFAHYFRRNTATPTVTQVSTTEVALTYQDRNDSGYELSSYRIPLDKGIYVVDIYATTSAVGAQRAYYTWGIYSTESSGWAQLNGNTPMDNQTLNTYVPFVTDTNEHFYEVPLKLLEDGTGYICFATAGDGGVNATITVRSLKIRKVSING